MGGNLFPRFQAPSPRVRLGLRARCHFYGHDEWFLRVAGLSHLLSSGATAGTDGKTCRSRTLPYFASRRPLQRGECRLNIPRKRFSPVMARFGLSATCTLMQNSPQDVGTEED